MTIIYPSAEALPSVLKAEDGSAGIRITKDPYCAALINMAGVPIVSTSANVAGEEPAREEHEVRRQFGDALDYILSGPLGGNERPSVIRDLRTDEVVRAG